MWVIIFTIKPRKKLQIKLLLILFDKTKTYTCRFALEEIVHE
jgi:hypothetical protein